MKDSEKNLELKVSYSNFKKLGTGSLEAKDNLIIVGGDNRAGKTSLIKGILENLEAKKKSDSPVTIGKKTGYKQVVISENGSDMIINHTFSSSNPNGKFYLQKNDGTQINKVTEIRKIIGDIAPYTVEDVFRKYDSKAGRTELIKKLFYPLLDEKDLNRINEINNLININGTIYAKRTNVNKKIDALKLTIQNNIKSIEDGINEITIKGEKVDCDNKIKDLTKNIISIDDNIEKYNIAKNNVDNKIKELNNWINNFDDLSTNFINLFPNLKNVDMINNWLSLNNQIKEKISNYLNKIQNKDFSKEIDKLKNQKINYNNLIFKYSLIKQKKEELKLNNNNLEICNDELRKINNEINELTEEKAEILSNSKLPKGIEIISDSEFTYNGFSLNSDNISESEGWLLILKLMMNIFPAKLIFAGNIGIYNNKALSEIKKLAIKYNKICLVEKVTDEPVTMTGYINYDNEIDDDKENDNEEIIVNNKKPNLDINNNLDNLDDTDDVNNEIEPNQDLFFSDNDDLFDI